MHRLTMLALIALLLAGCRLMAEPSRYAGVQPGVDLPPTPHEEFITNYGAFRVAYDALKVQNDAPAYDDPEWRAETVRMAQAWRETIEAIQTQGQPDGADWRKAWPLVQAAMDDCLYVAGAVENAAKQNNQMLLLPVPERLANSMNLLNEAIRLTDGEK